MSLIIWWWPAEVEVEPVLVVVVEPVA